MKERSRFESDKTNVKEYAKKIKLSGRDQKEKDLMKLKYDRMNSAMRKVVNRSHMEFM